MCAQIHSGKQNRGTQNFVRQNIIAYNFLNRTLNNLKYIIVIEKLGDNLLHKVKNTNRYSTESSRQYGLIRLKRFAHKRVLRCHIPQNKPKYFKKAKKCKSNLIFLV